MEQAAPSPLAGVSGIPHLCTPEIPPVVETKETTVAEHDKYSYWRLPHETPELYEKFGVKLFKKWMPTTGDKVRKYFGLTAGGLDDYTRPGITRKEMLTKVIDGTKVIEKIHLGLVGFVAVDQVVTTEILNSRGPLPWLVYGSAQVIANLYPIMLQRYNRLRAQRILGRMAAQSQRTV